MTISNWLESPDQFRKLLTALVSDRWDQLMDSLSMEDPVLRQFAATQWAQRRLPEEPDALAVAALLIAYHFRCLLVDSLRSYNLSENELQEELNVTLLLPLFIWPVYRIWILQESPPGLRVNQMGAVQWLLDSKQRQMGFSELEIDEPDSRLLAYLELKRNTTNLSRWIKAGLDRLYHAVHTAVVQAPPARQKPPAVVGESSDTDELDRDVQQDIQDIGISRPSEIVVSDMALGISEDESAWFDSPIFKPYLNWEEASRTFLDLHKNGNEFPSLTQVARAIIDRKVLAWKLDIGQQALALELLSDLPDWMALDNPGDQSISLKNIEYRWRQFHSSDPTLLVKALLETNLLQIASQDGRIRFGRQLIHDYYLSLKYVKSRRSMNPIPPAGQSISSWLYWMATHWIENGVPENAGLILWYAAGSLPGYMSDTWRQIANLLRHLPQKVLSDGYFRLLDSLAREALSRNGSNLVKPLERLFNLDYQSAQISQSQVKDSHQETDNILREYAAGIEHFGVISNSDPLYALETAIGYDRTSRNNHWHRKHAFSALRELKPTKVVYVNWLPFVSHQKTMQELILDTIRREVNWDIRLAAAEILTFWGTREVKLMLEEREIRDLPVEYYNRARILKGALGGIPGYIDWV